MFLLLPVRFKVRFHCIVCEVVSHDSFQILKADYKALFFFNRNKKNYFKQHKAARFNGGYARSLFHYQDLKPKTAGRTPIRTAVFYSKLRLRLKTLTAYFFTEGAFRIPTRTVAITRKTAATRYPLLYAPVLSATIPPSIGPITPATPHPVNIIP